MKAVLTMITLVSCPLALLWPQPPTAAAPGPVVTISLASRQAHASPFRQGFTHTGGGNIDVSQPAPDTVILSMSGVAVAGKHPCKESLATLTFDLVQCFEISFEKPEIKKAKLTLEARVIGLLRGSRGGTAEQGPAQAHVSGADVALSLAMPAHHVGCGDSLSVNDREGPVSTETSGGKFTLNQTFAVTANHSRSSCFSKAASAEFAPDPGLDPLWISYWEPFHGAGKKDFGFQVILKVAP